MKIGRILRDELPMFLLVAVSITNLVLSLFSEMKYWSLTTFPLIIVAVIYKIWQREKQSRIEKTDRISTIVKARINAFEEKFGDSSITSIHFVNAASQFLLKSPTLWQKYHGHERVIFKNRFSKVKERFEKGIKTSDINEFLWCFNELATLTRRYEEFMKEFYETFKNEDLAPTTKEWYNRCVDEYNDFGRFLEDGRKEIEAMLGTGILAPQTYAIKQKFM